MLKLIRRSLAIAVALLLPAVAEAGPTHQLVSSFDLPPQSPSYGSLTLGPDGFYWGTAQAGGTYGGATGYGAIYRVNAAGTDWQTMVSFSGATGATKGRLPYGGLTHDGAGYLWGTTYTGGGTVNATYPNGAGTVFKYHVATGVFTTVAEFTGTAGAAKGSLPWSTLLADGAGNLWGTTQGGGALDLGTVFKVNIGTGVLTTVFEFTGTAGATKGSAPQGDLMMYGGSIWGTTFTGGASNLGTIFKIDVAGGTLETKVEFTGAANGSNPQAALVSDGAGYLWGTASAGGALGFGSVFKVDATTGTLTLLVSFSNNGATNKGNQPLSALVADGLGNFWGTTRQGGTGVGAIYKVSIASGTLSPVLSFTYNTQGGSPSAGLVNVGGGFLWGTTQSGGPMSVGTVYKINTSSNALTNVVTFNSNATTNRGSSPYCALMADASGSLWGTTISGGTAPYGTVFKVNPVSGTLTTVQDLTGGGTGKNGSLPYAGLTSDAGGTFYWGATAGGGAGGLGSVFKIAASTSTLTTQFSFGSPSTNRGATPQAKLVSDGLGYFWGVSKTGATNGNGTVFKVNASTGVLTTVAEFTGNSGVNKGSAPVGSLVSDGTYMWGTTSLGGVNGVGTVFKLPLSAGAYVAGTAVVTTVVEFGATVRGSGPFSGLTSDGAGFLWGTTSMGGNALFGTIFKVEMATGILTTVVDFTGLSGASKGSAPWATLASDGAGKLWGTTNQGGAGDFGTVFNVNTASGAFTTVLEFTGIGTQAGAGANPGYGALLKHTDGNFYGTTAAGGPAGGGTIYRLRYGPSPLTQAASSVAFTTATLNGSVNPNGIASSYSFQYGTSATLAGATTVGAGTTTAGSAPEAVSVPLSGLAPGTTYYYRVVASNSDNAIAQQGAILSFATGANSAPTVTLTGANPLTVEAAAASYTDPGATANDPEDGVLTPTIITNTVNRNIPGAYAVTWRATDTQGTSGTATRTVNVVDTTAPVVVPPANVVAEATGAAGAIVSYPGATATDFVGVTSLTYSKNSGTTFALGPTTVTVTARDAANNVTTANFTVTVRDTTAPLVTPPANVTVAATSPSGAFVSYAAAGASDAVGVTSLTYSQVSGTTFPIGTTTVTVTARDAANNAGTATFTVTVNPLAPVESWRYQFFGSISNSGSAADDADPDGDGIKNLLEFGTHTNPTVSNALASQVMRVGNNVELTYTRAKGAMNSGVLFEVEWNEDLAAPSWNTAGVSETIVSQDANVQQVKATVSVGTNGLRFVRLRVHRP